MKDYYVYCPNCGFNQYTRNVDNFLVNKNKFSVYFNIEVNYFSCPCCESDSCGYIDIDNNYNKVEQRALITLLYDFNKNQKKSAQRP